MIKIFIGTEEAQWLPTQVLRHSVLRRTKAPVEFIDLIDLPLKLNLDMYTGFSFYRWYIPEACNYTGRALYLDADIIVLEDIQKLAEMEMGGKGALARDGGNGYYTSVMLLDCDKLKNWKIKNWAGLINARMASYDAIMIASKQGLNHKDFGPLPAIWNGLDEWTPQTKILHYTHLPTQPWKKGGHPLGHLFLKEMKSAIDASVITREAVEKEIQAGHVYPEILRDMDALA